MAPVRSSLIIFLTSLTPLFATGIPVVDAAKNTQETALVMLLGTGLDPSTLLGKTVGILDTSLEKLNINMEELQQLQQIYATFGDAISLTKEMTGDTGSSGAEAFAAQQAMNSDAMEKTFDAQRQQAKALGMDPSSLNAMRELNNQSIRNYAFTQAIKQVKQATGKNMGLTERLALSNVLNGLNADQINQQMMSQLIAANVEAMQSERSSQDTGLAQKVITAMHQVARFAGGGSSYDPNVEMDSYAPPRQYQAASAYDYQGSQHQTFADYQNAYQRMQQTAGATQSAGNLPPGNGSLADSAHQMIGVSTVGIDGTDGGNLGCAAAVSLMFKNATGQNILPGQEIVLGTGELYSGLSNDPRFVKIPLSQAQAGDIVVTARGSGAGHTGVVVEGGQIISNSSGGYAGNAKGTIQQNYSVAKWQNSITPRNPGQTAAFRYVGA